MKIKTYEDVVLRVLKRLQDVADIQELRTDLQDRKTAVAREERIEDFKEYNLSGIGE